MWAAAQAVAWRPQRPVNPAQPPRDRLPPPQRVGTAVLKGRVVDGATGDARAARARALARSRADPRPPVLTDAEGAFELTALPAGNYSLQVEKSTYLTGAISRAAPVHPRQIDSRSSCATDKSSRTSPFRIFHGAAIAGRVFDAHGDPVDHGAGPGAASIPRRTSDDGGADADRTISVSFGFRGCNLGATSFRSGRR